jgi:hypothetical protein
LHNIVRSFLLAVFLFHNGSNPFARPFTDIFIYLL